MTTKQISKNDNLEDVFVVYKRIGETPLQCLDRLRLERPQYKDQSLSYAGRLDPLASGLLLVLAGDPANRNRESYLGLEKTYEVEVLFGVSTDTYDALGLVVDSKTYSADTLVESVNMALKNKSNFDEMDYPPYSSKPVNGKSLFQWAREGKIDEIVIPKQQGEIKNIELLEISKPECENMPEKITEMVTLVKGDFRQQEILAEWKKYFDKKEIESMVVVKVKIECGSGSYMRSFAHRLGQIVGVPALALTICRTKIGKFDQDSLTN